MGALLSYRTLAYNNGWANQRLLNACAQLSQAEFVAPQVGFFPNLRATLNHILVVDRFYIDALEGGTLGLAAFADREPCETVVALRAAQAEMDRRLISVVDAADLERTVAIHREDRTQHEPLHRVLMHLFQHQIHHRGQAHTMLSSTTVAPPQLDEFFLSEEEALRAKEFAELGWTEEMAWGPKR